MTGKTKEKINNHLMQNNTITIPELMFKFKLDYSEAKKYVTELLSMDFLIYQGGITYSVSPQFLLEQKPFDENDLSQLKITQKMEASFNSLSPENILETIIKASNLPYKAIKILVPKYFETYEIKFSIFAKRKVSMVLRDLDRMTMQKFYEIRKNG